MFRTTLKLSNGISLSNINSGLEYAEMIHTSAYQDRNDNYNNGNQSLPGVSEDQDVTYRPNDPSPTGRQVNAGDKPFAQPGQIIKPIKEDPNE